MPRDYQKSGVLVAFKKLNIFFFILLLVFLTIKDGGAEETSYKDSHVKAIYILNLMEFVSWPNDTKHTVCVIGSDMVGASLAILESKKEYHNTFELEQKGITSPIENCTIVFISSNQGREFKKTLFLLKSRTVLTVSDIKDFAKNGGMIELTKVNDRLRFSINTKALEVHNLTANPELLRLAEKIYH